MARRTVFHAETQNVIASYCHFRVKDVLNPKCCLRSTNIPWQQVVFPSPEAYSRNFAFSCRVDRLDPGSPTTHTFSHGKNAKVQPFSVNHDQHVQKLHHLLSCPELKQGKVNMWKVAALVNMQDKSVTLKYGQGTSHSCSSSHLHNKARVEPLGVFPSLCISITGCKRA